MTTETPEAQERPDRWTERAFALGLGLLLGALVGLAFAGLEAAVMVHARLTLPDLDLGQQVIALYMATGALFGGILGGMGYRGARWAIAMAVLSAGWLLSGMLAAQVAFEGAPPLAGLAMAVAGAGALALTLAQLPHPGVQIGLAVAIFVATGLALPLNLHLVADPLSQAALILDGLVVLVALAIAGLAAAAAGDGRSPRLALGTVLLAALAWGLAALGDREPLHVPSAEPAAGPAVALVVIDGLRADHLGAYGHPDGLSPHLDALAREGLVFLDASSTAPWTLPSTASMLTGQMPSHHGAGVNPGRRSLERGIRVDVPTVPQVLTRAGYLTGAVTTSPYLDRAHGFSRGLRWHDDRTGPAALPVGLHPWRVLGYAPLDWPSYRDAEALTADALGFIQSQPEGGWFLWVQYMDAHGAVDPGYRSPQAPDPAAYRAAIQHIDAQLGRLIGALPDQAWVFVTSDHGRELWEERPRPRRMPRGTHHGHNLYQEMLHVPLIVQGPGLPSGRVSRPVSLLDLAPTIFEVSGVEAPPSIEGAPLPEVFGMQGDTDGYILAEGVRWGTEQRASRQGWYKLVHQEGRSQVFDLISDPVERRPMASHTKQGLQRRLENRLPSAARFRHPVSVSRDVMEVLEQLRYED